MKKNELAELINVSRQTLSAWEKEPKKFNLVRMLNLGLLEQEIYTQGAELRYLGEKIEREIFEISKTIENQKMQKKLNEIFTEIEKINNILHDQYLSRNKVLESRKIITYKKDETKIKLFYNLQNNVEESNNN